MLKTGKSPTRGAPQGTADGVVGEEFSQMPNSQEPKCAECGHVRSSHVDKFGGICVGCPCSGFKNADYVSEPGPGFDEAVKNVKFDGK